MKVAYAVVDKFLAALDGGVGISVRTKRGGNVIGILGGEGTLFLACALASARYHRTTDEGRLLFRVGIRLLAPDGTDPTNVDQLGY